MSDKDEATRLADVLDFPFAKPSVKECCEAAALLRRWPDGEPVAWADAIIDDLHALHDSELIREIDSGDALIRLDAAIATVEEARDRHAAPPDQSERIAALERENAQLRADATDRQNRIVMPQRERIAALEAALEQARVALDSIARNTCCDGCQEAARVAQSALRAIGEVRK